MTNILGDKFGQLGPVDEHDSTLSIEAKFQKHLVKWVKSSVLLTSIPIWLDPLVLFVPVSMVYLKPIKLRSHSDPYYSW